jgi:hypothetical protein
MVTVVQRNQRGHDMTHFNQLAMALKTIRPNPPSSGSHARSAYYEQKASHVQWRKDCEVVADICQRSNANFNRDRFLSACGIED